MDTPSLLRTQRSEGSAQLGGEKLRLFPRGEVSAFVDFMKIDQVLIGAAGPRLRRSIDVLWKYSDGHRQRDFGGLLRARTKNAASRAVLPVQPPCRGTAVRQPVQSDVVQHVVFSRGLLGIAAERPLREAWMHEHPRQEGD